MGAWRRPRMWDVGDRVGVPDPLGTGRTTGVVTAVHDQLVSVTLDRDHPIEAIVAKHDELTRISSAA